MRLSDLGIYIPAQKLFYYLEGGPNFIGNTIDRLKRSLVQKGYIYTTTGIDYSAGYEILSVEEAKRKEYELQPIYISKHIQKQFNKREEPSSNFK